MESLQRNLTLKQHETIMNDLNWFKRVLELANESKGLNDPHSTLLFRVMENSILPIFEERICIFDPYSRIATDNALRLIDSFCEFASPNDKRFKSLIAAFEQHFIRSINDMTQITPNPDIAKHMDSEKAALAKRVWLEEQFKLLEHVIECKKYMDSKSIVLHKLLPNVILPALHIKIDPVLDASLFLSCAELVSAILPESSTTARELLEFEKALLQIGCRENAKTIVEALVLIKSYSQASIYNKKYAL